MKKAIILLAIIGISYNYAEAQTKSTVTKTECKCKTSVKKVKSANGEFVHQHTAKKSTSSDTYQVCREMGGHYECCTHNKKVVTKVAK